MDADDVDAVGKALRSPMELLYLIAHRTMSADFRELVVSVSNRCKQHRILAILAPSPGEHEQDGMLHGFSCLPRALTAAPIAQACCPATELSSFRSNRYHIDDRLTLTTSHRHSPQALHRGWQEST